MTFQNQYKNTFGEDVDLQVAEAELNKLARLVETMTPKAYQTNQEDNRKELK